MNKNAEQPIPFDGTFHSETLALEIYTHIETAEITADKMNGVKTGSDSKEEKIE